MNFKHEVYKVRERAREELGPMFWANDPGYACILVVVDAALGEALFALDGTAFDRKLEKPSRGEELFALKFVFGKDWTRQRTVLMQEVITDSVK